MAGSDGMPAVRGLSARSIMLSALMGAEQGLTPRLLLRFAGLFDVSDGTARVALSRMVQSGEVSSDGPRYLLAGRLDERRLRQEVSRRGLVEEWDGSWETWIVRPQARDHQGRQALRAAASRWRLAELREGVWLRPSNLKRDEAAGDRATLIGQCDLFVSRPEVDPAVLAARLWDLESWSRSAKPLIADLRAATDRFERTDERFLVDGFLVSSRVVRHLLDDPLLPAELLPEDWLGHGLREEFEGFDRRWQQGFRAWSRESDD